MNLGENISKYRKKLKLSQKELANLINVSDAAISRYEHGAVIPPEIIVKLSDVFGITTDELLGKSKISVSTAEVLIPVIKSLECPDLSAQENITEYIKLPKSYSKYSGYLYKVPDDLFYNCGIQRCSYIIISFNAPLSNGDIIIYTDSSKKVKTGIFNMSQKTVILSDLQGNAKIVSDKSHIKIKGVVTHYIKRYK